MKLNIALVGCDTSHVVHFSRLLNDSSDPQHIAGARVVAAVIDGYGTISGSREKAIAHAAQIEAQYGVKLYDSMDDLPTSCDAIFIENTDGARHLEQFQKVIEFGVPVFIDKPLALSGEEAEAIFRIGQERGVPIMSSSALRYDASFVGAMEKVNGDIVTGADIYGCTEIIEGCPGLFWYGIHSAEMLFAAMGPGVAEVHVTHQEAYDLVTGTWDDGRIGTIRGTRKPHWAFGGTLHTKETAIPFAVPEDGVPFYAPLLREILNFATTGISPIENGQSLEIIRFLEEANRQMVRRREMTLPEMALS
jgi:predicted dehydrogenase